MPRTRRYIFNTLTVVSVLLLLATVGLWVREQIDESPLYHEWVNDSFGIAIATDNGIVEGYSELPNSLGSYPGLSEVRLHMGLFPLGSFSLSNSVYSIGGVSLWFPALILAILPAIWLLKWNKRRKLGPNACSSCGYYLTGNTSGVCPECGLALKTEAAKA